MAKQAATLEDNLKGILDQLGNLPSVVGKLADAASRLADAMTPLWNAVRNLMSSAEDTVVESAQGKSQAATVDAINRNTAATDKNTNALGRLSGIFERMISLAAQRTGNILGDGKSPLMLGPAGGGGGVPPAEGGGLGSAVGGAASMLGKVAAIAGVAGAALGVFVVGINMAEREFQKIVGLVKLFNPGVVQMFQFALDNLGATIGRAFVPVVQAATGVVREWTAALAPVIQRLTPIMQEFSGIIGNLVANAARALGQVLQSMVPLVRQWLQSFQLLLQVGEPLRAQVAIFIRGIAIIGQVLYEMSGLGVIVRVLTRVFEAFSKIMDVVSAAFDIFEVVITTLVDSFAAMLQSILPLQSIMDTLSRAVQFAIRNLYVFSIMLAKLLGLDGVADALIRSVEDKTKKGDTAAQSPQIKSLDQLSKDLALAAASAAGAAGKGGVNSQQEFWKQTLEEMRIAKNNGVSMKDILAAILTELKRLIPGGGNGAPPMGPAPGAGGPGLGDAAGVIANPFGFLGRKALGL